MEKIDFNATDGIQLNGLLYNGEKTSSVIIAVHGMSSDCFKYRNDVISKKANENNIDYFCFNNRGADLVKYLKKNVNGKVTSYIGGTAFEDVTEGYNDIVGAINKMQELGYTNIYLQGHSLGSTKVVYTYNKLLEENNLHVLANIKGIILLSLIDVPTSFKVYLKDKAQKYITLAEEKIQKGEDFELMPKESFMHPISPRTFLQYSTNYDSFDFINTVKDENLEVLNNISVPLFMRWGSVHEMILQDADRYSSKIREIIKNENADIGYIEGADHGYHGREEILANQIVNFIEDIQ